MILVLLLHLSYIGLGLPLTGTQRNGTAYRLSRAYAVGLVLQMLILYAAAAIGLTNHILPKILFALGLAFLVARFGRLARAVPSFRLTLPRLSKPSPIDTLLVISLLPPIALISLELTQLPLFSFDAIAIWGAKANYLFFGEYLGSDAFTNPGRVHPHPGYPLLLPLFFYQHQALAGGISEPALKTGLWLFESGALAIFFLFAAERVGRRLALASLGLLLYTPILGYLVRSGSPSTAYADFPLALFMLMSAGFLLRYLEQEEPNDLLAAVACLIGTMLLKFEGLFWAASVLALTFLSMVVKRRRPQRRELYSLGFIILVLLGYRIAHAGLPPSSDLSVGSIAELLEAIRFLPMSTRQLIHQVGDLSVWGVLPWIVGAGYLLGVMRSWRTWRLVISCAVIVQLGFFLFALALAEVQLGLFEHYSSATFPRWLIQLAPVALFCVVAMGGKPKTLADEQRGIR